MPRRSVSVTLLCLVGWRAALAAADDPPVISHVSEGVQGGETFLVCGDGFQAAKLEVIRWVPPQAAKEDWGKEESQRASLERFLAGQAVLPAEPPPGRQSQTCEVVSSGSQTLAARQPSGAGSTVQPTVLWVRAAGALSKPWLVNRPILWWAWPEFPAPGQFVRAFGRNLTCVYGPGRAAFLRGPDGTLHAVEWGMHYPPNYDGRLTPSYEFEFRVPPELTPGEYRLYVHAGGGGDLGWSDPLTIAVRPCAPAPAALVKASDLGAAPDDQTDDADALQRAMDDLSKAGGGTMQLAPGTFLLSHSLVIPAGVCLRGAGMNFTILATPDNAGLKQEFPEGLLSGDARDYLKGLRKMAPLVAMPERCSIERLTIRGGVDTLCAVLGGGGVLRRELAVREVEVLNLYSPWQPKGEYRSPVNGVVLLGPLDGLEIRGCRFLCAHGLMGLPGLLRRAHIVDNQFRSYPPGRYDPFSLRDPVECLVENNTFQETKRGIVIQPQPRRGMAVHNVLARNVVEHVARGGNAGETELWEVGGPKGLDRVAAAGPDTLTAAQVRWEPDELAGFVCLIVAGRGLGQYRLIRANTADTLTLQRPWIVRPNAGSRFLVTRGAVENITMNSTDRDGDAALQLWGTCIGNVISGHIADDTEGVILFGSHSTSSKKSDAERITTCWLNDLRLCRFEAGAALGFWANVGPDVAPDRRVPLVFGNTARECRIGNGPRLDGQNQWYAVWELLAKKSEKYETPGWSPAVRLRAKTGHGADPDAPLWDTLPSPITFNLIERNQLQDWPVGVYQARSAKGNVILGNAIGGAKEDVVRIGVEQPPE